MSLYDEYTLCSNTMRLATGAILVVVLPVLAVVASDSAVVVARNDNGRALQTPLGDICSLLISAAVGATIPQLGDTVSCECDPTLVPSLSVSLSCASTEPVCLGDIVCGTPSIDAGLDITALLGGGESPITFEVCYTEAIVAGTIELPSEILCLSFLQTLLGTIGIGGGGGGGDAATAPVGGAAPAGGAAAPAGGAAAPVGKKGATPGTVQGDAVRTCTATLGGQECSSCSFCDGGMIFDCSNIDGKVATSECIPMKVPNDIDDVYHPDAMIAA
jgi:hypothetical protein